MDYGSPGSLNHILLSSAQSILRALLPFMQDELDTVLTLKFSSRMFSWSDGGTPLTFAILATILFFQI